MGSTLTQIAEQLKNSPKKVQLIYAFNGTGKTRLSKEFKELIAPKSEVEENEEPIKILYYNAFTEDLFSWDNGNEPKLIIKQNSFTTWILEDQGQDQNIKTYFQRFSGNKLTPNFTSDFSEVSFSFNNGDENNIVKISKGEESNFIWSIFYVLIEQVINILNVPEKSEREINEFDNLEYIFIDDPVSSLDENHLIELSVNLAQLIKFSKFDNNNLKFILSTHNPLFYNVLYNELGLKKQRIGQESSYMLNKNEDGSFELNRKSGDSNKSFSYHLYLRDTIQKAIDNNEIAKYHFVLLRNLYEKTANFLGYSEWSDLLPDENREAYISRVMNFYSHSSLSSEQIAEPTDPEKQIVKFLFNHLINESKYWKQV